MLFPEGERSIDGPPKMFKKGAAILAMHTQCPIVPVAIEGFYEVWPRGENFKGPHKLQVRFLDPVEPPALGPNPEQQYAELTAEVRNRIAAAYEELRARR
jgi:1-acyl-sn-glycerol-3-phosphate acyltransferase